MDYPAYLFLLLAVYRPGILASHSGNCAIQIAPPNRPLPLQLQDISPGIKSGNFLDRESNDLRADMEREAVARGDGDKTQVLRSSAFQLGAQGDR